MMTLVFDALRQDGPFDFSRTDLSRAMQQKGYALANEGFVPPPLPIDVLFVQRKLGGVFLLASKLRARVDLGSLFAKHL